MTCHERGSGCHQHHRTQAATEEGNNGRARARRWEGLRVSAFMESGAAVDGEGRMTPRYMTTAELIAALEDDGDDRRAALIAEAELRAARKAFPRWRLEALGASATRSLPGAARLQAAPDGPGKGRCSARYYSSPRSSTQSSTCRLRDRWLYRTASNGTRGGCALSTRALSPRGYLTLGCFAVTCRLCGPGGRRPGSCLLRIRPEGVVWN
jgi:hypothetical protein